VRGRISVYLCARKLYLINTPRLSGTYDARETCNRLTWIILSLCSPNYADVKEGGHRGNAKRLECVQLAGAFVKRGRAESGSKLHALQTLRARGRPHRAKIRHRTYVPEYLGQAFASH
jgi:hypothetical protein